MSPELRERFAQVDFEVWSAFLQQQAAFVRKEVWIDADDNGQVVVAIEWSDRDRWKSIPQAQIAERTREFDDRFGHPYELVASREFQVRKR